MGSPCYVSTIAALVVMAGQGSTGREILTFQQRYMVDSVARMTGAAREAALAQYRRNTDSVAAVSPWMRFFIEHDPVPVARRVRRTPVLVVHGALDMQVPVREAALLDSAFRRGGNRDVTVRVFPGIKERHDGNKASWMWPTYAFSKGSYSCPMVGQVTTIFSAAAEPELGKRLHFAGEHTSADFAGFMNGAVESGNRVAAAILD